MKNTTINTMRGMIITDHNGVMRPLDTVRGILKAQGFDTAENIAAIINAGIKGSYFEGYYPTIDKAYVQARLRQIAKRRCPGSNWWVLA